VYDELESLRALYLDAVEGEAAIGPALAEVAALRTRLAHDRRPDIASTLTAYEGAIITLRAKHGFWPNRRLLHLRQGLDLLDAVVASHPANVEARYLRLMSCFYLPPILGRRQSVRDDFAALATLLPTARQRYRPDLYNAIATFVLEEGRPDPATVPALRDSLWLDD
jgi:hypothetical protein